MRAPSQSYSGFIHLIFTFFSLGIGTNAIAGTGSGFCGVVSITLTDFSDTTPFAGGICK